MTTEGETTKITKCYYCIKLESFCIALEAQDKIKENILLNGRKYLQIIYYIYYINIQVYKAYKAQQQ